MDKAQRADFIRRASFISEASRDDRASFVDEIAQAAAPHAAEQKPIAYRMLHRTHQGEWTNGGRYWCDGAPPAELVENANETPEQWRIEIAYAAPPAAQSSAEWLTQAGRLADYYAKVAYHDMGNGDDETARAALLAHLRTKT